MIEAPEPDKSKTATRAIAEALAQATPVTAGLARLYQYTHPSEFEQEVQQWRRDISDAVNGIHDRLQPRLVISDTSLEVARVLVQQATNGHRDSIDFRSIATALPDFDDSAIQEACHDLEQQGLLSIERAPGRPVLCVSLDVSLFRTFDPYFRGTDPAEDAIELVHELLEQENGVSASDLEAATGWSRRRFNPAFTMVVDQVPGAFLRQPIQPDYPATRITVSPEVRASLKRFVAVRTASMSTM